MSKLQIILASSSPRRVLLLRKITKRFKVIPSRVNENNIKAKTPDGYAIKAALAKALDVAKNWPRSIVIGADTIVVLRGKILGKPQSKKAAVMMLKKLSGQTHQVITAVAVVFGHKKRMLAEFAVTNVKFGKLKFADIIDYVQSHKPLDKAGAYGIQEIEEKFNIRIKGEYANVVGLPVKLLKKMLKKAKA